MSRKRDTVSPFVSVREASRQKGPFWLRNSRGAHKVARIHRVNGRLYEVVCEDKCWFAVDPQTPLWRQP